ncbi:RSC9 [[Candida] subhashii]|uniref:RSC9 n=1 Tax=[Candida] subhashii TaxID=561895 RepID=A0A8J5USZ2_9ASCO|nr:RSC9 [[Candida] subhashii]KAG7661055.1 RSC9 [[Candida] subhashii]
MSISGLAPVTGNSRTITAANDGTGTSVYASQAYNGYGYVAPIGYNHRGIDDVGRITMSLKSGIDSEVKWALNSLSRISLHPNFNLEHSSFLGSELIKYFYKPFQLIGEKKYEQVTQDLLTFSLDSLLTLRNSAQDLHNQQWLSQIKSFKKNVLDALKFLSNWFYQPNFQIPQLKQYDSQFSEALSFLIDLLEPLTCYYIDNTKHDPLFHVLLQTLLATQDKTLFVTILKCLSHLLIIRDRKRKVNSDDDEEVKHHLDQVVEEEEVDEKITNNCINSLKDSDLEHIVNDLLINDNEINNAVLEFLKMYLFSEALHPDYSASIKDSQKYRLQKLLQLKTSRTAFHTLVKQLPLLTVANLPLNDPSNIKPIPQLNLTRRSEFPGVPSTLPELTEDLYKLIIRFPEPLRATTWLRCCYEPFVVSSPSESFSGDAAAPGEVTQISLWKAYEKQFQEIWNSPTGEPNPQFKPLLPAVDFIKNVTRAFPSSEAMVVNLPAPEGSNEAPKKKFIIRGIQPRQFAVNIDVANYEALKPNPISSVNPVENHKLPIGHIDVEKFNHAIAGVAEGILVDGSGVTKKSDMFNQINESSHDILEYIIHEVLDDSENSIEENIFRLYNSYWLPELVYANPSLVESGIINASWLKYLI